MSRSAQRAKLVELATVIWRAFGVALPKLPPNTQAVMRRPVVDGDLRWVLSLMIAAALGINRSQRADVAELGRVRGLEPDVQRVLMAEMGAGYVVAHIDTLLPRFAELPRALTSAKQDDIASALARAVNGWPDAARSLNDWLEGPDVLEAAWALVRRFPDPNAGRPSLWGEAPDAPSTTTPKRGERFDHADYSARRKKR
ncbi:hypothetical protein [Haliangium sp. UPWRP_2]|uniref:hypothetical protein n=1 Tax=Haliangium sp. UPWRP_2 TaxID=1931276 RepID=UPI000B542813|nr:hypothetical protein [Haliangium sp. UPWRP_2]PSM31167.1 hypothetical protein BVG81_006795 [Haliangium sp. UPWRP_2]